MFLGTQMQHNKIYLNSKFVSITVVKVNAKKSVMFPTFCLRVSCTVDCDKMM